MTPCTRPMPVDWVLERSASIWVGVIQTRMARGDAPEAEAKVFAIERDWFGVVRWPAASVHHELVLKLDRGPRGEA